MIMAALKTPFTLYRSFEAAERDAKACRDYDHDWTYTVEPRGMNFVIVAWDEERVELGPL